MRHRPRATSNTSRKKAGAGKQKDNYEQDGRMYSLGVLIQEEVE